jgi:hypothetical protein
MGRALGWRGFALSPILQAFQHAHRLEQLAVDGTLETEEAVHAIPMESSLLTNVLGFVR